MTWNDKFSDFGDPYNLFEYFQNKDIVIQNNMTL